MQFYHRLYFFLIFKLLYVRKMRELKGYFASKTPYTIVENLNVDEIRSKGWGKPQKIWMVIRHGTRFPSVSQVRKMNAQLPSIHSKITTHAKGKLSNFEMGLLGRATKRFSECNCSKLTKTGKSEMKYLARRTKKRFSEFLVWDYDKNIYQFRLTHANRTLESAQQFAYGLFGEVAMKENLVEYLIDEKLLRFYKLCSKWRSQIRYNSSSLNENRLFQNTSPALSAVAKFNQKLGLNRVLTYDDIQVIYKACIVETCSNKLTAWCIPFNGDIMKVFEYSEDLKHYWFDGFGYEITYRHACPLLKDMIEFFNSDREFPKAVFNFTHSGALLKLLTHLHLYKDDKPLTHDDFNTSGSRKWRISKIGGFGSNLIFALYIVDGKSKILVLHQERIIRLPCCPNSDLCDLDVFREYYRSSLLDCNFDQICENF